MGVPGRDVSGAVDAGAVIAVYGAAAGTGLASTGSQLWTQDSVTFQGIYYKAEGVKIEPRPINPPPIWLGRWGQLSLARAAVGDPSGN